MISTPVLVLILIIALPISILLMVAENRLRKQADAETDPVVKQLKHMRIDNLFHG
jgi:hypothetical protein